jgi:hypothetical protein
MDRSPRHTGVRTPSLANLAQHSLQSGSGLGRDLLPPLSAISITIAHGTMLEPITHAKVECSLHLDRLDHPLPHSRAIGENSEFRYSRRGQDPTTRQRSPRNRQGVRTKRKATHQELYSLGMVSGLSKKANMICPQQRPKSSRSPCGIWIPNLGVYWLYAPCNPRTNILRIRISTM